MTKTIAVEVPDWVWGRLASIADTEKRTVGDLVADQILLLLGENPQLSQLEILQRELVLARRAGYRAYKGRKSA